MRCFSAVVDGKRMTVISRRHTTCDRMRRSLEAKFGRERLTVVEPNAAVLGARREGAMKQISELNL